MSPAIKHIKESFSSHAFATIVALRLLHDHFSSQFNVWKLIESKSLKWIKLLDNIIDWEDHLHIIN